MEKEKVYKIIEMSLRKVVCYRNRGGSYIIFKYDEENTERVMEEIMDIIKVCLGK